MTSTTSTAFAPLTRDDVAAFRTADSVSFHRSSHFEGIRLHLSGGLPEEPRVYSASVQRLFPLALAQDRRREVIVEQSTSGGDATCFTMIHSARFSDAWTTIAHLLRAGDKLRLFWYADAATTTGMREVGLHGDELRLTITREGAPRPLTFVIDTRVSPDNTARMVRR